MPPLPSHVRVLSIAALVAIAGLLWGLDTGSIGPITEMKQFQTSIGHLSPSQQGVYVACILLSGTVSSLASGTVSDRISRRYGLMTGGALTALGAIGSAASDNFASLIVSRLISGVGLGQAVSVGTVYIVEIAPAEIRGVAACLLQLNITVGITSGYFAAFGSRTLSGSIAWRTPFILQAVMATILSIGMIFVPFSPRWLVQQGKTQEAAVVLGRLRKSQEAVITEMEEIKSGCRENHRDDKSSFKEIFGRRYIKRTTVGVALMALQQMTGIDAVLYYAPILFQQAGLTTAHASFLASGVTGIVLITCTIPAQIWVDEWGRKKPLVIGGLAITFCLLTIGSLYGRYGKVVPNVVGGDGASGVMLESRKAQWAVIVLIYLFTANFSWSWAVIVKIYSCEIIPTRLRAKVCAVEQLANWLVNFVVALTAPPFLRSSPSGPYFLYGFSTLATVVLCCFIPETKGRSLEQVEALFEKDRRVTTRGEGSHSSELAEGRAH